MWRGEAEHVEGCAGGAHKLGGLGTGLGLAFGLGWVRVAAGARVESRLWPALGARVCHRPRITPKPWDCTHGERNVAVTHRTARVGPVLALHVLRGTVKP